MSFMVITFFWSRIQSRILHCIQSSSLFILLHSGTAPQSFLVFLDIELQRAQASCSVMLSVCVGLNGADQASARGQGHRGCDSVSVSLCHIKRHVGSVCPIAGSVHFDYLGQCCPLPGFFDSFPTFKVGSLDPHSQGGHKD